MKKNANFIDNMINKHVIITLPGVAGAGES